VEWKELTKKDAQKSLALEMEKLLVPAPEPEKLSLQREFDGFQGLFGKFIHETGPSVHWDRIEKLPHDAILPYAELSTPDSEAGVRDMLEQLVVIKLNGGLGTSMGCSGPKSVIPVRSDLTFLDLTVQQIEYLNKRYSANVPLVLMNSFNTDEDTMKIIRKYSGFNVSINTFNQSRYPRINKESLMPIAKSWRTEDGIESWYPPGHGDFYRSFFNSGLLDQYIKAGKKYCFISNIDNLGATVDLNILNMVIRQGREFVMEVTDKTRADVKGGTLIQYEEIQRVQHQQLVDQFTSDTESVGGEHSGHGDHCQS